MRPNKISNLKEAELLLQTILGARLTSVQFVLNYLILGFDEKGALTTLVWPQFLDGEKVFKFGMQGYRDQLCGLIEQVVRAIEISSNETIRIVFSNNSRMHIPLQDCQGEGERAIFTAPKHRLLVF
jgi:hypothetical protein